MASYMRRRNGAAKALCDQHGTWSSLWLARAKAWDSHVLRHPGTPASTIRLWHDEAWLQRRRAMFTSERPLSQSSWTITAGRTDTRSITGRVQQRWQSGIAIDSLPGLV